MKTFVVTILFALLAISATASAQSMNASISGTVTDPAGAVIPNVTITAENVGTAVISTTKSNEAGIYDFPSLPPGVYRLSAEAPGFRNYVYSDVTVNVSARLNLNFALELAGISQAVEVQSVASPLATSTASVGGVITGEQLQDLPLPDRDVTGLVLTQPGLVGDNFSGARIGAVNVTRDGINVMDQFINSGVKTATFTSTDLIAEVRVTTSPVDAESGRGSGQVEMITKSGTNVFHGTVFESNRNTALTANTWFNNQRGDPRNDLIRNQFGGALGGPIIKKRTFFYFLYDAQRQTTRDEVTSIVYTSPARQGLFRYFPGVLNGNANASTPTVDLLGSPVQPARATGPLQTLTLFNRDPNRPGFDPSGTGQRLIAAMPQPNDFRYGDGLNTAGVTWRRRDTVDLDQFNIKLDHLFNERHSLNYSYTHERIDAINGFMEQPLASSPAGNVSQGGTFYSLHLTSTLSPTVLNDFRAGAQRVRTRFYAPWESTSGAALLPKTAGGYSYLPIFSLADTPINTDNDPQGRISPLYIFADRLNWQTGRHTLKGGGQVLFRNANGFSSDSVIPRANFGAGGAAVQNITASNFSGIVSNLPNAQRLLVDLSGSLGSIAQAFNSSAPPNLSYIPADNQRTWRQREFSMFFQDDLKLKPNLTLNLGLRYEYYGVPWEANGKAAALVGGSAGIFGLSGTSWADLYQPGLLNGSLTQVQLVGKNSPNPRAQLYKDDWNNFAPVFGLSWGLPYFGKDKTVLRVGYSVAYEQSAFVLTDFVSGIEPGLSTTSVFTTDQYLSLSRLQLPLTPTGKPLDIVSVTDRRQRAVTFDSNLRTPYIQNWNLSLERELPGSSTVSLRYVGSKGTKLLRSANINEVNIFETGLLDAFQTTQRGGTAPLFDRIFRGLQLGLGRIDGTTVTASSSLRYNANTYQYFADNDIGAFASYLNSTSDFTGSRGGLLRNGFLPQNFIVGNPQFAAANFVGNFSNSTWHAMELEFKKRFSRGWTLESNYTWSKALGDEEGDSQDLQNSFRNGRNRHLDKRLLGFDIEHVFRNSGTFDLPFGPGKKFLGNTNGWIARLAERWQIGGILNAFSGSPLSLDTGVSSFNQFSPGETPDLVATLPKSTGSVKRTSNGVVYFDGVQQVPDPAIDHLTSAEFLNESSSLFALADSSSKLIAVNPTPGRLGNMAPQYLRGPGWLRFDLNTVKRFRIRESKEFQVRVDAINVLNHPQWGNPNTNINSPNFGRITSAGGNRIIVLTARVNF